MRRACDCGGSRLSLIAATLSRSSLPVHLQADRFNPLLRRINLASGLVTTLAGAATSGRANGVGTAATFNNPRGVAVDAAGAIVIVVRVGMAPRASERGGGSKEKVAVWLWLSRLGDTERKIVIAAGERT